MTISTTWLDHARHGACSFFTLGGSSGGGMPGLGAGSGEAVAFGNEDRHAAFFLTIADEKNKPEFCKSDPWRRLGWGWGGGSASPVLRCLHRATAPCQVLQSRA